MDSMQGTIWDMLGDKLVLLVGRGVHLVLVVLVVLEVQVALEVQVVQVLLEVLQLLEAQL